MPGTTLAHRLAKEAALTIDIGPKTTLKAFGQALINVIWQEIEKDCDNYVDKGGKDVNAFKNIAYRKALNIVALNCSAVYNPPALLKWRVVAKFCGVGRGFRTEVDHVKTGRLILMPSDLMKEALGYDDELFAPFDLPEIPKDEDDLT